MKDPDLEAAARILAQGWLQRTHPDSRGVTVIDNQMTEAAYQVRAALAPKMGPHPAPECLNVTCRQTGKCVGTRPCISVRPPHQPHMGAVCPTVWETVVVNHSTEPPK